MAITFTDRNKTQRIREPLFQIARIKYRSPRKSELENVETNLLRLDMNRILTDLEETDSRVNLNLVTLLGSIEDLDTEAKLDDGVSYIIEDVNFYEENVIQLDYSLKIDSMDKLSSKLSRLYNKLSRLENGN